MKLFFAFIGQQIRDIFLPDQFIPCISEPCQFSLVYLDEQPVVIQGVIAARRVVIQVAYFRGVSFQFHLRPFAFADVAHNHQPATVGKNPGADFGLDVCIVLALQVPFLGPDVLRIFQKILSSLEEPFPVCFLDQVRDTFADKFIPAIPEHASGISIHIDIFSIPVCNENAVHGVIE